MLNQSFIERVLQDSDTDRYRYQSYRAFLLLWLLLETWLTELSGCQITRKKLDWFRDNSNYLKDYFGNSGARKNVVALTHYCPVYDKRFNPPRSPKNISNPLDPDIVEVVEVVYQIRNNLVHGNEDITKPGSSNLYSVCGHILYDWLRWSYHQAHKNKQI